MTVTVAGGTKIEWADFTFNPWWGCERVSPACAHCYADTLAKRRVPGKQLWGAGHGFRWLSDAYWRKPLSWARTAPLILGRRPRVFCASMADVFEDRPELEEPRRRLFALIDQTPELDWLLLTKRPEFARDWLGWHLDRQAPWGSSTDAMPPNVWLGVSIENARFTWRADVLREVPAAVRFISAEPLLGSLFTTIRTQRAGVRADAAVYAGGTDTGPSYPRTSAPLDLTGIDWVIVGGESGPRSRPTQLDWIDQLIANAREHELAVFVKQLGTVWAKHVRADHGLQADAKGGDPDHWPYRLRIREHPRSAAP